MIVDRAGSSSVPSTASEELDYAEFLLVRQQLAALQALPEGVTSLRSEGQQREIAELYNAFEHYTAMADIVFEELQRRLDTPIAFSDAEKDASDFVGATAATEATNVLTFRPRR